MSLTSIHELFGAQFLEQSEHSRTNGMQNKRLPPPQTSISITTLIITMIMLFFFVFFSIGVVNCVNRQTRLQHGDFKRVRYHWIPKETGGKEISSAHSIGRHYDDLLVRIPYLIDCFAPWDIPSTHPPIIRLPTRPSLGVRVRTLWFPSAVVPI